jgi:hypothetical protein
LVSIGAPAAAVALAAFASSARALADESIHTTHTTTMHPPVAVTTVPTRDVITYEESTPNGGLIAGGLVMFGLSYVPSVIIGAASGRAADQNLYIPVAGPWIDLANRDKECPGNHCIGDTANKVLLVTGGVFQGVGVMQVLGGFLFPTTRVVTRAASVQFRPTAGLHEVGISAQGSF